MSNFSITLNKTIKVVKTGSLVAVDCVLDGVMLNAQSCLVVPLQTLVIRVLCKSYIIMRISIGLFM
jgi:hypothetical protein